MNTELFTTYPDIVDVKTMAKMLRVGMNTAYMLVDTGAIASVRIGRMHRIPKKNIIGYVMGGEAIV
ncbi:MAG: helix-turn-helix domain-containing protein [Oscillospiraceae bacterium]|nr:helix-turn-helix domain-containing protein [Oscillospiraceae bacterium]MBQ5417670.1 helix-turn-helix domain-containing protein [Oscillospiraceae bacterium]